MKKKNTKLVVNSTVTIATEVFKKAGTYDEKKLFGVTTLDVIRAKTFYAGKAPSLAVPKSSSLSENDIKALRRTQDGGTEDQPEHRSVAQWIPPCKGFPVLKEVLSAYRMLYCSIGGRSWDIFSYTILIVPCGMYARAVFADACLKALNGVPDVVVCSYVQSGITKLPFFASKVKLGKNGVEVVLRLGSLSDFEQQGLESLKRKLKASVERDSSSPSTASRIFPLSCQIQCSKKQFCTISISTEGERYSPKVQSRII
ncbi:Lactate/malate dehydrogenase, C-terminal [Dillenia turbinata]|uniref:Lactate/malate dehydrogenase, C-terminal n=1 Tax=Dillenia turbinata TaxID=194707 RepID=A0AAN8WE31_9MAGN